MPRRRIDPLTCFGVPVAGGGLVARSEYQWYVDTAWGGQYGTGKYYDKPLETLAEAVTAAVTNRGDVIHVAQGAHSITETITLNKAGLTIMAMDFGANPFSMGEKHYIWPASTFTTGPCLTITQPCRIIGLGVSSRFVGGESVVVQGEGGGFTGGWNHFYRCRFPDWIGNAYGITFEAGAYNVVEECHFEGFTAGISFEVTASNNPTHNIVRGCFFHDCTYGIEHVTGVTPHHFLYDGNYFIDSKGINFNDQAADGLVCNNNFETATDAATYDITVNAANAHGVNFCGNNYAE